MNQTSSPTLEEFISQCQKRINSSLVSHLEINFPSDKLKTAIEYACLDSGKRIRPVLAYGSNLAVGGNPESADTAACAVELIHCYSLVHDDLPAMDDDDLRRGKPTVHKAFDEATAILVGDALQSLAFQLLSSDKIRSRPENQLKMINVLSSAAGILGMASGQSLDFEAVGEDLSVDQLETTHNLKTGALINAAVLLGAMSHDETTDTQLQALENYGRNIGLAFQVQDDILDVTSDTHTLGKPQGSDHSQNKPTYVSLLGLEEARNKATALANQAIQSLADFPDSADHLRQLASYIVRRVH